MDITQIAIKINQTNLSNREKSNLTTKMEDPVISFDQVLSMFNLEQSVKSPIQNGSDQNGIVQTDSQTPSKEDLSNLDSILTTWVAAIQQVQNWPATEGVKSTDQSSGSEVSDTPGVTNVASQLQQLTTEGTEELAQWLQKVNGQKSSTLDPRMLLQEITKIIANPETPEQPKAIVDKIQIIMNELESENNFGFLFADKKSDPNLESKMGLSLDKNQALVSYIPGPLKRIIGENSSTSSTSSSQMEDLTKSTGMSSMINQQQGSIGMNESTVETVPSQLTVSEFAPEVSEWIGRYIRISGGQSGSTEAKFSLYPEHLGHIEIKITSQQGQIAAQIITDTSMAKDALEGQLQQLRQALQQHGLLVQKLDIVQQIPVSLDWNQGNLSFSQGGSHSSYEQKSSHLAEDEANNQEETDQQEIEIETASISYGGAMPKKATNIDFTA